MQAKNENCPECGSAVAYWQVNCRCGRFLSFPNFRAALAERSALSARYGKAIEESGARGTAKQIQRLEEIAEQSNPVITMPFPACDDILRSGKYRNYHQRIFSSERHPATRENHADRSMVGEHLFPTFSEHIHYAALSPDGWGLPNYGSVTLRWNVSPDYLDRRISLLEENSFIFFEHHKLGKLGTTIPVGYQSVWGDRKIMAVAKLGNTLNAATGEDDLPGLLLHKGRSRLEDDFIEVIIYAESGIDTLDLDMVTLEKNPSDPEEWHRWEIIKETCAVRRVAVSG